VWGKDYAVVYFAVFIVGHPFLASLLAILQALSLPKTGNHSDTSFLLDRQVQDEPNPVL